MKMREQEGKYIQKTKLLHKLFIQDNNSVLITFATYSYKHLTS